MKFGIIGDVHIADNPPSTRKDDFRETVMNKLNFIIDYSNANQYSALVFVGDIFHKKIPSYNSHSMISALIRLFERSTAPVYVIAGNHDIYGNLSTLPSQPLNVLVQSGVVKLLDETGPVLFKSTDGQPIVSLNGHSFSPTLDSKTASAFYSLEHEDAPIKISVFHQMLLPDGKQFFDHYINFEDLKDINCDLVVCGHYHEGFTPPMVQAHNKYFLNPGAITRGTAEQSNLNREPKFVELTAYPDGKMTTTEIPIPFLPAEDVFNFQVIENNRKKKDMHEFMEGLSEMENQALSTQEPTGVITVLKAMGMSDHLSEIANKYLQDAYAELA